MARRQAFWKELLLGKHNNPSEPVYTASLTTPPVALEPARAGIPAVPEPQGAAPQTEPPAPAAPATPPVDLMTPFAFGDFTWMNAVPRSHDSVLDGKYFSGEFRVDTNYIYDYNHPIDHTLGGTTEGERTGEVVLQRVEYRRRLPLGPHGRAESSLNSAPLRPAVPRNDASPALGRWDLAVLMYRYTSLKVMQATTWMSSMV